MTDRNTQDHRSSRRVPVLGRRTRVVVALLGSLLSAAAPGVVLGTPARTVEGGTVALPGGPVGDASNSAATLNLAPSAAPDPVPSQSAGADATGMATPADLPNGPLGIPGNVLDAYQFAQQTLAGTQPGCHLSWSLLAGIGRIESDHASGGRLDAIGNTRGTILGPRLDGSPGVAAIPDTDHGLLDGDTVWDRAVGPMQFLPSTWRQWGVNARSNGVADPNNVYDATVTAGRYLCAASADLSDPTQLQTAVYRYNQSWDYVTLVLQWAHAYLTGVVPTPSAPGPIPPGTTGNGGRSIITTPTPPAAATTMATMAPPTIAATTPNPPSPFPTTTPAATTTTPSLPLSVTPTTPPATTPRPCPPPSPTTTSTPTPAPTPDPLPVTTAIPPTTPSPPSPSPTPATPPPTRSTVCPTAAPSPSQPGQDPQPRSPASIGRAGGGL